MTPSIHLPRTKPRMRLIALAASVLMAGSVHAQNYGPEDEGRRFSDGSRVVCKEVEVRRASSDPNRIGGTAAGAVIGGIVGSQIGSGSGRDAATIGGAIAGGAIGRKVQGDRQESRGDRDVETRCERVWR